VHEDIAQKDAAPREQDPLRNLHRLAAESSTGGIEAHQSKHPITQNLNSKVRSHYKKKKASVSVKSDHVCVCVLRERGGGTIFVHVCICSTVFVVGEKNQATSHRHDSSHQAQDKCDRHG
jgi:hypothetical protein